MIACIRCIKTFARQDLDIPGYQFVIHENMNFAEYKMSHKGAAGKAFSAPNAQQFTVKKLRDSSVASLLQNDITKTVCCHSERSEESKGFVISPRIAA
jgi:hypothetical protein